jgi:hypothetical protein
MGDRFALVRMDSGIKSNRRNAGRQALCNVGHEETMRTELAAAAGAVLAGLNREVAVLTNDDQEALLDLADLVTLARTAVERDVRGEVVNAHAAEAPTRFAKMLGQVVRGALALGVDHKEAMRLACRVAGDSMPPLRLDALGLLLRRRPMTTTASEAARILQKPRTTVDRTLQELHLLELAVQHDAGGRGWPYELSDDVDRTALAALITRNVSTGSVESKEESTDDYRQSDRERATRLATDIPGDVEDDDEPDVPMF